MDRVFFEGVRCFATRQEVPLAPLTVLVGENSSGKSTVLALIRLAWDAAIRLTERGQAVDFNEEPFFWGAYKQIASDRPSRNRVGFSLGLETWEGRIESNFSNHRGLAVLRSQFFESSGYRISLRFHEDGQLDLVEADAGSASTQSKGYIGFLTMDPNIVAAFDQFQSVLGERPYAFAPIRTRPRRTYDPIIGRVSPEGDHVPMLLASLDRSSTEKLDEVIAAVESFGLASGLFEGVEVRLLGAGEGDPFQIQIHIGGKPVNMIDVGYGVSQVLPIIVDCLRGNHWRIFLLQQPEVHLHPRAQAELGSFLATLAKGQGKQFVVETHSDYLVDRIRMDIRDKKGITPEDVALLYFERKNGEVTIHRLELDDQGNILNAPPGYRSFFLEEERRFLGG